MIGMINHNQVNKVNCSQLEKYQKVLLTKKDGQKNILLHTRSNRS